MNISFLLVSWPHLQGCGENTQRKLIGILVSSLQQMIGQKLGFFFFFAVLGRVSFEKKEKKKKSSASRVIYRRATEEQEHRTAIFA